MNNDTSKAESFEKYRESIAGRRGLKCEF